MPAEHPPTQVASGQQAENSVGLVESQTFHWSEPFPLQSGATLAGFKLVYETYGKLNENHSNAILICHALSGHQHAAGFNDPEDSKPGWWDACIGPGKPIDTNLFYVVSLNNLGGCHGSTGPRDTNPATGQPYGPDFPTVVVSDWVNSQTLLADHLGIKTFAAIIGGSLGGMQAMQWAIDYPQRLEAAVVIAAAAKLSAQNIAFNEIARQAIASDPNFHQGHYAAEKLVPDKGLGLARMIGHVTYLSDDGMREKFGREIKSGDISRGADVEFQVESYLRHQGQAFSQRFDANTYMLMTKALDYFDPARDHGDNLVATFAPVKAKFLILSFTSDWRFSVARSKEITNALIAARKNVASAIIESEHGHDSFLLPLPRYVDVLKTYLARIHQEVSRGATS
jgi:homoserine O-acetyltransferase